MTPNEFAAKWRDEHSHGTGLLKLVELIELDLISDEPPIPPEKGAAALRFFAEVLLPSNERSEFRALLQNRTEGSLPKTKAKPEIENLRHRRDLLERQVELAELKITDTANQKERLKALEFQRDDLASKIEKINNREIFE